MFVLTIVLLVVLIEEEEQKFKVTTGLKRLYLNSNNKADSIDATQERKQEYENYLITRKELLQDLISLCINNEELGLKQLRDIPENQTEEEKQKQFSLFKVFVDLCLVHFVDSVDWKWRAYSTTISEIFTPSDEAMAMLFFENYVRDYKKMSESGQKVVRKYSRPKYTKTLNQDIKFHGWHVSGIKRYNHLRAYVSDMRSKTENVEMEESLRNYYRNFCNRKVGNHTGGANDCEESNNCVDESDEDAYDEWADN